MIPIITDIGKAVKTLIKNLKKHKFCYFIDHKWGGWLHSGKYRIYVTQCKRCKRKKQRKFIQKNDWE